VRDRITEHNNEFLVTAHPTSGSVGVTIVKDPSICFRKVTTAASTYCVDCSGDGCLIKSDGLFKLVRSRACIAIISKVYDPELRARDISKDPSHDLIRAGLG